MYRRICGLAYLLAAAFLFTCEKVPDYCGKGQKCDFDTQFCFDSRTYNLCNGHKYNPLTQGCTETNEVGTKCLDNSVVPLGTPCRGYNLNAAAAPANAGNVEITRASASNNPHYAAGEKVVLKAIPEPGYTFTNWAGAETSADPTVTVTMDANKPIVAIFKPTAPMLATAAFPGRGGAVTRNPPGPEYADGTEVTVTATPYAGYTFSEWSGASTSKEPEIKIKMDMDSGKTLIAIFTPAQYTLTININPEVGGAVFVNGAAQEGAAPQNADTQIEAIAIPAPGYVFTGWTGAAIGPTNPVMIAITACNPVLIANFRQYDGDPVHAHSWGNWTVTTPATCEAPGVETRICRIDASHTETRGIARLTGGQCDTTHTHTHDWGEWVVTTDATCDAPGVETRTCQTDASHTETRAMPQLTGTECAADGDGGPLSYGGQAYRTVIIGGKRWMAENLNYAGSGGDIGECYSGYNYYTNEYEEETSSCAKYGRLYTWSEVMGLPESCNSIFCSDQVQSPHRGICPAGWHVPSLAEWDALVKYVGGGAGTKLKSKSGWYNNGGGNDTLGFSALPGGFHDGDGFGFAGRYGYWWSATEDDAGYAWYRVMHEDDGLVSQVNYFKTHRLALRCSQDVRP